MGAKDAWTGGKGPGQAERREAEERGGHTQSRGVCFEAVLSKSGKSLCQEPIRDEHTSRGRADVVDGSTAV